MNGVPLNRWVTFWSIALVGCAIDLWTKHFMFSWLGMPGGKTYWIIDGIFGWQTSLNQGALFGMGQGMAIWFAALSVLAGVGINYWLFVARAALDRWLTVALGCIMAGVLGNLYDRLGMWNPPGIELNAVRDWILFEFRGHVWPNFNLADTFLVCGAIMLCWHALQMEMAQRSANKAAARERGVAGA